MAIHGNLRSIDQMGKRCVLPWVSEHFGTEANETAEHLAKTAKNTKQL